MEKKEEKAFQRKPLDAKVNAEIIKSGNQAGRNSLEATVADIATNGKASGWRVSEHSQTKLNDMDYHKYPSGKEVMKAINGNDIIFSDKNGNISQVKKESHLKQIYAVVIT